MSQYVSSFACAEASGMHIYPIHDLYSVVLCSTLGPCSTSVSLSTLSILKAVFVSFAISYQMPCHTYIYIYIHIISYIIYIYIFIYLFIRTLYVYHITYLILPYITLKKKPLIIFSNIYIYKGKTLATRPHKAT